MDAQLSSDIVLAVIGALVAVSAIGIVGAFWSMGRADYRKN